MSREVVPEMQHQLSLEAYFSVVSDLSELQRKVYKAIELEEDITDKEIEDRTGLSGSTARPRRIELERKGLIYCSGFKVQSNGRKASTWRVK